VDAASTEPLDRALLAGLDEVIRQATAAMDDFEYTTALERIERFFWFFCDDYVELVKERAYGESDEPATQSARLTLRTALSALLRLLAPFVPYATEEAWSWWHPDSVHTVPWPVPTNDDGGENGGEVIRLASTAIGAIRKAKSDAKRSMKALVDTVRVTGLARELDVLDSIGTDLRAAGRATVLALEPGEELRIEVTLSEE
jgi:valyl-tRNA synthetase